MPTSEILVTEENHICTVKFNRPHQKNAINEAMYTALSDAMIAADNDPDVHVLLITGDESCFTAGNDLREFLEKPPTSKDSPGFRFLRTLVGLQKPLVAAVNGPAVGIGTTLLLHCDLVYAGESAVFILPFINLGLCPENACSLLLPQTAGHRRAAELLMLGEPFNAETAQTLGIINSACPDAETMEHALATAEKLAAKPPLALRQTKALMKSASKKAVQEMLYEEIQVFSTLLHSAEAKAAMTAFLRKS
ncbi:MAG: enoyl-CoA hydratase [Deferribacteres bacterium]|nr:enoyl-CoA hydratase [candidate division KSB1 bacterium]MCB9503574.1 enoyl-CoA hydratase [Deferribacteres bacterium]